jgi:2-polyprenyl-6-methoxyphenol hydroxylase-like FAD-dependent oxidoreductase
MRTTARTFDAAIVVGGSIAGLICAKVLAQYFDRVTVIERDPAARQSDHRRGVPQARHAHTLLLRGQQAIDRFFPEARRALLDAGATQVNMGRDVRWHHFGVWKCRYDSKLVGLSASRPLIEWTLRDQLRTLPNVTMLDGWSVNDFLAQDGRITGVRAAPRETNGTESELSAELVVDASGRGSQTPARLVDLGFRRPDESTVKIDLGYATRIYRAPAVSPDWKSLYVISQPPEKRGALILPLEGGRWIVTQIGMHGDHPPTDEHAYLEFAKSLPVPDVYEAIRKAEPLTEIVRYGFPNGLRRHYELLRRFPDGLLVLGDAFCSFNPIYGQGMSTSAMYTEALDHLLQDRAAAGHSTADLWKTFFPLAAAIANTPWQLATTEDLRYEETEGLRIAALPFMHWYTRHAQTAAGRDSFVTERLYEIMHLLRAPTSLFAPGIIKRVIHKAASVHHRPQAAGAT